MEEYFRTHLRNFALLLLVFLPLDLQAKINSNLIEIKTLSKTTANIF